MNINLLNERLQILNIQLQDANDRMNQAMSDVNAISGAIQEVNYWINVFNSQNIE